MNVPVRHFEPAPAKAAADAPKHVLIAGGLAQSLTNFRGPLVKALLAAGHRVTAAAGDDDAEVAATLRAWGANFVHVPLARAGMNPLADIATIRTLAALMRDIRPDVYLGYTIKPVTYGLMAARLAGVPKRHAMITGLGYAFTEGRELKRRMARVVASCAYRVALRFADRVIFQNADDEAFFVENGFVKDKAKAARVNGSGVDLAHFTPAPLPRGPITFLMIARLLRDKGVYEYVDAARIVKQTRPDARFVLVGPFDPNPAAVKPAEVEAWVREGVIDYQGAVKDVRPHLAACHVYVLPSYREGMPRTVLEAMATGRAVITTDAPGCRQAIEGRPCGMLVKPRSADDLARALLHALEDESFIARGALAYHQAQVSFSAHAIAQDVVSIITGAK